MGLLLGILHVNFFLIIPLLLLIAVSQHALTNLVVCPFFAKDWSYVLLYYHFPHVFNGWIGWNMFMIGRHISLIHLLCHIK